jgi:hypothetical protein
MLLVGAPLLLFIHLVEDMFQQVTQKVTELNVLVHLIGVYKSFDGC